MNMQFGRYTGGGLNTQENDTTFSFPFYMLVSRLLYDMAQPRAVDSMEQRF
jgi:hypothetical protein